MSMKELPIYKLHIVEDINSDVEVNYVALVDRPAIERDFLIFNKSNEYRFVVQDEQQRIISGPLMVADLPIYRSDAKGEYYVVFDADTIKQIALKFFKKGYQNNVNLMHEDNLKVDGVTMFESWIVDSNRGIKAMKGFEDVADGSWFGSFKVENDAVWNLAQEGKLKGFSVEGIFNYGMEQQPITEEDKMMQQIIDILNSINE